ncbi:MAG: Fic family protein [Bdellovibrio sp.]
MNFSQLDQYKEKLDSLRPLPPASLKSMRDDLALRLTYNSNAIEGNTLTLQETKVVLEGITIGGKLIREHFEAINHAEAFNYIEHLAKSSSALTEFDIKSIHQLILKGIDDKNAGIYRHENVIISGALHKPPDFILVPNLMTDLVRWYAGSTLLHPVERAARIHSDFVKIHPFTDGNGRTSRLLMNLELLKNGFPITYIPIEKRLDYYRTLDLSHTQGDYEPFIQLVASEVKESFEKYFQLLNPR